MSLNDKLTKNMITAMKSRDSSTLSVIRQLKTDLTNKKISLGRDLNSKDETAVVMHEVKQHKQSIDAFKKGKRSDLVKEQKAALKVLMKYAPKPLTSDQVQKMVKDTIQEVHASSMKDFGKVMGTVMSKAKGRANGSVINKMVKKLLK